MSQTREKFIRLAESRTQKVLDAIHLIGNLSNPTNYAYTDKDVDQIFKALNEAMKEARSRFKASNAKDKSEAFRLEQH